MPIGSGASYRPVSILPSASENPAWTIFPGVEENALVLKPNAPQRTIYFSPNGWNGGDRCAHGSQVLHANVPIPDGWIEPNGNGNQAGVFLRADGRTLVQNQPITRCGATSDATAWINDAWTINQMTVDLYGNGINGAQGGSAMSSIGGALRVGELRPGDTYGPRHALKMTVYSPHFARPNAGDRTTSYRWPAPTSDGPWATWYGNSQTLHGIPNPNYNNSDYRMGALLAIPANVNINALGLESKPGQLLAWTYQNYGAYVVDGEFAGIRLAGEKGPDGNFASQFQSDYGMSMSCRNQYDNNTAWCRDFKKIAAVLNVVSNNGPNSIGGGGTPRQPLAPEIAP